MVRCIRNKSRDKIRICDDNFVVRVNSNPMQIYRDMQMRAFLIAGLTYIEQRSGTYKIRIVYFADCSFIEHELTATIGKYNLFGK